jgi:hypothetical protein
MYVAELPAKLKQPTCDLCKQRRLVGIFQAGIHYLILPPRSVVMVGIHVGAAQNPGQHIYEQDNGIVK